VSFIRQAKHYKRTIKFHMTMMTTKDSRPIHDESEKLSHEVPSDYVFMYDVLIDFQMLSLVGLLSTQQ